MIYKVSKIKLFGVVPVVTVKQTKTQKIYYLFGLRLFVRKDKFSVGGRGREVDKTPIYMMAHDLHSRVFPKYRNCNAGRDMVVIATGPTLDYYTPRRGMLHLGVNRAVVSGKVGLDYVFVQDYVPDMQQAIDSYKRRGCKKFYGVHYLEKSISQSAADRAGAERYCFIDNDYTTPWAFPPDISVLPFQTYSSVIHPAVTFALWTGVRRLYLVGCDTSMGGYANSVAMRNNKNMLHVESVLYGWRKFKEYAAQFYPDVEIISINPVWLRGLFRDVYTESYLAAHPEIDRSSVEIF